MYRLKEGLLFDLTCSIPRWFPAQSLGWRFCQQLLTQLLCFFGEFTRVFFLIVFHSSIDFFAFYFFLAGPEWCLTFDHFVQEATETEPVRAKGVFFVIYHFRCCKIEVLTIVLVEELKKYPYSQLFQPFLEPILLQEFLQPGPNPIFERAQHHPAVYFQVYSLYIRFPEIKMNI